jgi:signal transduction histidine kinase
MFKSFSIHTAYLLIGLLYVLLPILSWVILANQRRKAVALWCLGGIVFGLGAMLIGLRLVLNPLVSYTFAFGLLWFGFAIKIDALKLELNVKPEPYVALFFGAAFITVYEFFRTAWPHPLIRFSVGMVAFVAQSLFIGYLVFAFYKREKLQSLLWLFFTFVAAAALNAIKLLLVMTGYTEPDVSSSEIDGLLTVTSGLLLAVVGNFAFVGLYLERAVKAQESKLSRQVEQLERQRSIGLMATSFAHELSQPLTSIALDLEYIKDQNQTAGLSPTLLAQGLEEVQKTVAHAMALIARIRNYIHPKAANFQENELVHLLRDVATIVSYEARLNGVTFDYDMPSAMPVWCDKVEISQIVLNVYRNAIEAMQDTTERVLFVSIHKEGPEAVIQFRDTGVGITDAVKEHLGNAFFTTKDNGLGVGLSISKAIAEKHGGDLVIANAPVKGAIVTLRLPLGP